MSITLGSIVDGKYRVVRQIGKGGMGAVFAAEHLRIKRQVAIKVLHAEVAGSAELAQRFEREAQAAAQIGSQHIVEVLDCGVADDGERFMVMEFLDGETLRQRLKRGGHMSPEQAAPIFMQLLEGLAAAHTAGIIHRDLKPDNVYLERERAGQRDWVKILDFGISKFSEIGGEEQMTRTGAVMGTLFFMSPEQARSANLVDARSDLYSVGAMLFQALTGDVPFRATTLAEMLFKIVFDPLPHPRERAPGLEDDICAIILKAIARDPNDRFQSALEFREALAPIALRGAGLAGPASLGGIPAPASSGAVPGLPPSSGGTPPPPPSAISPPISSSQSGVSSARSAFAAPIAPPEAFEMSSSNLATSASMAVASGSPNTLSSERSVTAESSVPRARSKVVPIAVASVLGVAILGGIAVMASGSSRSSTSSSAASARESTMTTRASATATATSSIAPATTSEPVATASAASAAPSVSASAVPTATATVAATDPAKTTAKPASTAPAGKPASKPASKPGGIDLGY